MTELARKVLGRLDTIGHKATIGTRVPDGVDVAPGLSLPPKCYLALSLYQADKAQVVSTSSDPAFIETSNAKGASLHWYLLLGKPAALDGGQEISSPVGVKDGLANQQAPAA
jgi:hypothetical protein